MPDLIEPRPARVARPEAPAPAPGRPPRPGRRPPAGWRARADAWLRRVAEAVGPRGPGDPAVERLAGLAARARDPDEVRVALVRLAAEVSGAERVELARDREGLPPRRLAAWPPAALSEPAAESGSAPRGPIGPARARARGAGPAAPPMVRPLEAGGAHFGTLRLTPRGGRPWPAGAARRVDTLCAIAASAERALAASNPGRAPAGPDDDAPEGSRLLGAFLTFAHAQARRRREPLSLLEVAVDRLAALRELLGEGLAEAAIDRVARAIKATVRASDVTARLEDGRLAVLLPNASAENALRVAEAIRAAVARAGAASTTMPQLTASIGVATFPDHAPDVATLRAAAATALTLAEGRGHDRVAEADPADPAPGRLVG